MSTIPDNTEGVVLYPRFLGHKATAYISDTMNTAYQQVVIGKTSARKAFTNAAKMINAKLQAK